MRCFLFLLFLTSTNLIAQQATNVVISEFATRGASGNSAGEFVELYNPTDNPIDIGGWRLQYRSASGSSYSSMVTIPAGTSIQAHGFFLIASSAWTGTVTPDARWASGGLADDGNIRLIDATNAEIDRIGYGTGNDPKVAPAPNHGTSANDNSIERKASASSTAESLGAGGAEEFAGNGYNSGNNSADFIVQNKNRSPQNSSSPVEPKGSDGAGQARLLVSSVRAKTTIDIPIVFYPDPVFAVQDIKVVVPDGFVWPRSESDVSITGMTASIRVLIDSVFLEGVVMTSDSALITLKNQTTASQTNQYFYAIFTRGQGGAFREIRSQPGLLVSGGAIPIFDARLNDQNGVPEFLNQFVTINGVVTVDKQFGAPAYIQDATAGIAIYDFAFVDSVRIGDEVTVTGKVTQFNGLTELEAVTIDGKVSGGNEVVPHVLTIADLLADGQNGIEFYEGGFVMIRNVTVNTAAWTVSGSGTNYLLSDATSQMEVRVDNNVDFANTPAPGGSFDILGIVGQFQRNAPFIGGYQLMPRMASDIRATGPRITSFPFETVITPTSVTLEWTSGIPASAFIRSWKTDGTDLGIITGSKDAVENAVTLSNLDPATIYRVQAFSVAGSDTSFTHPMYVSSASSTSSGTVNIYFNQSVDNSISPGVPAMGGVNLKNKLLDRIDAAKHSIDFCLYSLSGGVGDDIAAALLSAKARGVKIRAIFESDNANSSAIQSLRANVPAILDNFDPVNAGAGLQHNKFFIIDARDHSSDADDWVITGSWNPTDPGTMNDAQNVVEIQDQALALTYTREFEEMWGGSNDTPQSSGSRFGARKTNNTPHQFNVNGTRVELFFSPTDNTTDFIGKAIRNAKRSTYFALLTFTRTDLAGFLIEKHKGGKTVRGVMDNDTDSGTRFNALKSEGVDVWLKKGLTGLLHHKYAVIDGDDSAPNANPIVITGSHNWSNSAESSNNENTVGIHSAIIARQYLQEWIKRYRDAGGQGMIVLGIDRVAAASPSFALGQNYPNPIAQSNAETTIPFTISTANTRIRLSVYDMFGRHIATLAEGTFGEGDYRVSFAPVNLPSGVYHYRLTSGASTRTKSMILLAN